MISIDLTRGTRHLCTRFSIDGIKSNVTWYSVIAVEFVYSVKKTRRFNSQTTCTVRVLTRFRSLLLAAGTSTVVTTFKKETMMTSTHNLPL